MSLATRLGGVVAVIAGGYAYANETPRLMPITEGATDDTQPLADSLPVGPQGSDGRINNLVDSALNAAENAIHTYDGLLMDGGKPITLEATVIAIGAIVALTGKGGDLVAVAMQVAATAHGLASILVVMVTEIEPLRVYVVNV